MKMSFKIIFVIISILIIFLIDRHRIVVWKVQQDLEFDEAADMTQLGLQDSLNMRISSAEYLKVLFELHPDTTAGEFTVFADELMMNNPAIRALQVTDAATRVKYVYPPRGNEITIDDPLLLIDDPLRGEYTRKAVDEKRIIIQPPFELRQGGLGMVARNPIFKNGVFIGLSIVVLDVSEILENSIITTGQSSYKMSLIDQDGNVFYDDGNVSTSLVKERIIQVADVSWKIQLHQLESSLQPLVFQLVAMSAAFAALLVFTFFIIRMVLNRSSYLQDEVDRRTQQLKDNEARLLSILENTGAGFFQIDEKGLYRNVNQAWLDLHGYSTPDEVIGKSYTLTQTAIDAPAAEQTLERLMDGNDIAKGESSRLKKDGTVGYHTFTARPYYLDGEITGIEGFIFDIGDHIAAEREKDLLMKELNHRVKNNLMIISSLLKVKDESLGDAADLSDISNQIDAISLLHDKLHQTGEVSYIEVKDYLEDLLETIFSSFAGENVEIQSNIMSVQIDVKTAVAIGLIINEIATNAIKYGFNSNDKNWFSIILKKDRETGDYVMTLSNSGNLVPSDVAFDHPETFGMNLVYTLAKQLCGSIDLQKHPETVFTLRFPSSIG